MDKQQEITTLQSLKGDTYFNQFFMSMDIDNMCNNIRNDFPIEHGCSFNAKATSLQHELDETLDDWKRELISFAQQIIDELYDQQGEIPDGIAEILYQMTSKLFVIKYKKEKNLELSTTELDYLIDTAELYNNIV